jgi:hypothetical protein
MDIPRRLWRTKYDGFSKDYTADCSSCPFYRELEGEGLCGIGVAFKYLLRGKNDGRACKAKNTTPERGENDRSVHYLDHFLSTRGLPHRGFDKSFRVRPATNS